MDENQFYTIILRHDTSTNWSINNPVLAYGEYGVEDDTHRIKRGDGEHNWNNLIYETFGVEFNVNFNNIGGEPTDNKKLSKALNDKISKELFKEIDSGIVTDIELVQDGNTLCNLTKYVLDVNDEDGVVTKSKLLIQSSDSSIQGVWSVDATGIKTLNLSSRFAIRDFKPNFHYIDSELCYYNNNLYKATEDFTTTRIFNEDDWTLIASLKASNIQFDNTNTGLQSTNVQDSIVELKDTIDNVQDTIQDIDNVVQEVRTQVEDVDNKVNNITERVDSVETKTDDMETTINNIQITVNNIESDIQGLEDSLNYKDYD